MPMLNVNRIFANLDRVVVAVGAIFAFPLTIWLLFSGRLAYVMATSIGFLACILYLVLRKPLVDSRLPPLPSPLNPKGPVYLVLNILFFALFISTILLVYLRPEAYVRPFPYFIITILLVMILAAEILFLPDGKAPVAFTLMKVIMLGLSLRWSQQLIFPSILGFDSWDHSVLVTRMLDTGYIVEGGYYSRLPAMHLLIGATSLVTGLNYKMSSLFSVSMVQAICDLSFIFLIGRFIWSYKAGLLGALLLAIANQHIDLGWQPIPTTLAGTFMLINIYFLFKQREGGGALIYLTLMFCLILIMTHPLVTFTTAILLCIFCVGSMIYNKAYQERARPLVGINFAVLFTVVMLAWWTYVSGNLRQVVNLIRSTVFVDFETAGVLTGRIAPELWEYMDSLPMSTTILYYLGMFLFFAASIIGGAYLLSRKNISQGRLVFVIAGLTILLVGFLPFASAMGVMHRWWYLSQILLSIPLAVALLVLLALIRSSAVKASMLAISIGILAYLMVMNPVANTDSPAFSKGMSHRYAFGDSELKAIRSVGRLWAGTLATDTYYTMIPAVEQGISIPDISQQLYTKDFSTLEGKESKLVLIRDEIVKHTFLAGSTYYKLDYDVFQTLQKQGYARIYSCGSVSVFRF